MTVEERFWKKVIKRPNGCWSWIGATYIGGGGQLRLNGTTHPAQRIAWEFANGKIPDDRTLIRVCNKSNCVNPEHYKLQPFEELFWEKMNKTETCWIWSNSTRNGYGRFKFNGKMDSAHRIAWKLTNGPIPDNLKVLHRCDNPACCNPAHLFLGTQLDNCRDREQKGRGNAPSGEQQGNSWLTERKVCEIRKLYSTGHYTYKELGKKYCTTATNICSIVNRVNWKTV